MRTPCGRSWPTCAPVAQRPSLSRRLRHRKKTPTTWARKAGLIWPKNASARGCNEADPSAVSHPVLHPHGRCRDHQRAWLPRARQRRQDRQHWRHSCRPPCFVGAGDGARRSADADRARDSQRSADVAEQGAIMTEWTDAKLRGIASDYFPESKDWPAAMNCLRRLLMEQAAKDETLPWRLEGAIAASIASRHGVSAAAVQDVVKAVQSAVGAAAPPAPAAAPPQWHAGWLVSDSDGNEEFINNPSALAGRHYKGGSPLVLSASFAEASAAVPLTYSSTQATNCAGCGERKHTPLRIDAMGGLAALVLGMPAEGAGGLPAGSAPKDGSTFVGWNGRWRGVARYHEPA